MKHQRCSLCPHLMLHGFPYRYQGQWMLLCGDCMHAIDTGDLRPLKRKSTRIPKPERDR